MILKVSALIDKVLCFFYTSTFLVCGNPAEVGSSGATLETPADNCLNTNAYYSCSVQATFLTSTCLLSGSTAAWNITQVTCPECCPTVQLTVSSGDYTEYAGDFILKTDKQVNGKVYFERKVSSTVKYQIWWHIAKRWVVSKYKDDETFTTLAAETTIPLTTRDSDG